MKNIVFGLVWLMSTVMITGCSIPKPKQVTADPQPSPSPSRCKVESRQENAVGFADLYIFNVDEHEYFMFERSGSQFVLHSESCSCKNKEK